MARAKYIDDLMEAPSDSLLVGTHTTSNREGIAATHSIIEGTPTGLRILAGVLQKMADSIESAEDNNGWGLDLHPEDIPALRTLGVDSLSLTCHPSLHLDDLPHPDGSPPGERDP